VTDDAGKNFLLPAFPQTWNALFKLYAPHNTTVGAEMRDGKVIHLKITAESRKAALIELLGKSCAPGHRAFRREWLSW